MKLKWKQNGLMGLVCLLLLISKNLSAQTIVPQLSPKALYDTIARMDSLVFSVLNSHKTEDIELGKKLFTTDLEFYHDMGGLTGYDKTINFFNTTAESGNDLRRELVPGTLEVYSIPNYGAMEIGQHRFCHTENSKQECGIFKFVHIWKYDNGQWKISRVVSYGH